MARVRSRPQQDVVFSPQRVLGLRSSRRVLSNLSIIGSETRYQTGEFKFTEIKHCVNFEFAGSREKITEFYKNEGFYGPMS